MDWSKYRIVEEESQQGKMKYRVYDIKGKHGLISLGVPIKEDTKEEIEALHRVFAEVALDELRREKEKLKNAPKEERNNE